MSLSRTATLPPDEYEKLTRPAYPQHLCRHEVAVLASAGAATLLAGPGESLLGTINISTTAIHPRLRVRAHLPQAPAGRPRSTLINVAAVRRPTALRILLSAIGRLQRLLGSDSSEPFPLAPIALSISFASIVLLARTGAQNAGASWCRF